MVDTAPDAPPRAQAAPGLRERLDFDARRGCVHDGPRRYLLMRADVLMGAVHALAPALRAEVLNALAQSAERFGGQSLAAYAQQAGHDRHALLEATASAAADLGWGRWHFDAQADALRLTVANSPFAAANQAAPGGSATQPLCAPVRGMLQALAALWFDAPAMASEHSCAAQHGEICLFEAVRAGARTSAPADPGDGGNSSAPG